MSGAPGKVPPQLGEFRIERELGRGAMGVVYLAAHAKDGRKAAVKVISPELASSDEGRARFKREVEAQARIRHPNIVEIYASGIHDGLPWYAMELLQGKDLLQRSQAGEVFAPRRIAEIGRDVAAALHEVHRAGFVHRDIKPSNIMIDPDGRVRLMDFGLARSTEASQHLTKTGVLMGSPRYMSPEQATGKKPDIRSDLYSLGIVLYELLTREMPFKADSVASLLYNHVHTLPTPIGQYRKDVPPLLSGIIERLLKKDANERFQTPGELGRAFSLLLSRLDEESQNRTIVTPSMTGPDEGDGEGSEEGPSTLTLEPPPAEEPAEGAEEEPAILEEMPGPPKGTGAPATRPAPAAADREEAPTLVNPAVLRPAPEPPVASSGAPPTSKRMRLLGADALRATVKREDDDEAATPSRGTAKARPSEVEGAAPAGALPSPSGRGVGGEGSGPAKRSTSARIRSEMPTMVGTPAQGVTPAPGTAAAPSEPEPPATDEEEAPKTIALTKVPSPEEREQAAAPPGRTAESGATMAMAALAPSEDGEGAPRSPTGDSGATMAMAAIEPEGGEPAEEVETDAEDGDRVLEEQATLALVPGTREEIPTEEAFEEAAGEVPVAAVAEEAGGKPSRQRARPLFSEPVMFLVGLGLGVGLVALVILYAQSGETTTDVVRGDPVADLAPFDAFRLAGAGVNDRLPPLPCPCRDPRELIPYLTEVTAEIGEALGFDELQVLTGDAASGPGDVQFPSFLGIARLPVRIEGTTTSASGLMRLVSGVARWPLRIRRVEVLMDTSLPEEPFFLTMECDLFLVSEAP